MNGLPLQSGGASFNVNSLLFKHRCETEVWEQILLEYNRVEFMATWNNSHGVPISICRSYIIRHLNHEKLCSYGHCVCYRKRENCKSSQASHARPARPSGKRRSEARYIFGKLNDGIWAVLRMQRKGGFGHL